MSAPTTAEETTSTATARRARGGATAFPSCADGAITAGLAWRAGVACATDPAEAAVRLGCRSAAGLATARQAIAGRVRGPAGGAGVASIGGTLEIEAQTAAATTCHEQTAVQVRTGPDVAGATRQRPVDSWHTVSSPPRLVGISEPLPKSPTNATRSTSTHCTMAYSTEPRLPRGTPSRTRSPVMLSKSGRVWERRLSPPAYAADRLGGRQCVSAAR